MTREKPRFTDNEDSVAQLCMLLGDTDGAIGVYEHVIEITRDDWNMIERKTVEGYKQIIAQVEAGKTAAFSIGGRREKMGESLTAMVNRKVGKKTPPHD